MTYKNYRFQLPIGFIKYINGFKIKCFVYFKFALTRVLQLYRFIYIEWFKSKTVMIEPSNRNPAVLAAISRLKIKIRKLLKIGTFVGTHIFKQYLCR